MLAGIQNEKRLLQIMIAILAATPVTVGTWGVLRGPEFLHLAGPWPADLDSHFRFLCGVFAAIGLAWYSCIPAIETKTQRFRLLAVVTFAGGLARLHSLLLVGSPSPGHVGGLAVELVVVPLLVLWQMRIANGHADELVRQPTN